MIAAVLMFSFVKGQNKWGFETMVGALLTNKIDTISSEKLVEMLEQDSIVLLDSRELVEYQVSHLEGAQFIGYDAPNYEKLNTLDKSKTIVIYCSIGKRSETIGLELRKLGFSNVYNLFGGIFDWTNRGFPVIDSEGNRVKSVHPYNPAWGVWVNNYKKEYGTE